MASFYEVIGVPVDADPDEVRRAYHRRAQVLHPDRFAASAPAERCRAESEMKALNAAWATLRDPEARRRYDLGLGLRDGGDDQAAPDDDAALEAEPSLRPAPLRVRGVALAVAAVLVAGIVASGVAMVVQADDPAPRWSPGATADLRAAAIEAGLTAPEADCFVRAVTSRYGPSDQTDPGLIGQFVDACC